MFYLFAIVDNSSISDPSFNMPYASFIIINFLSKERKIKSPVLVQDLKENDHCIEFIVRFYREIFSHILMSTGDKTAHDNVKQAMLQYLHYQWLIHTG